MQSGDILGRYSVFFLLFKHALLNQTVREHIASNCLFTLNEKKKNQIMSHFLHRNDDEKNCYDGIKRFQMNLKFIEYD